MESAAGYDIVVPLYTPLHTHVVHLCVVHPASYSLVSCRKFLDFRFTLLTLCRNSLLSLLIKNLIFEEIFIFILGFSFVFYFGMTTGLAIFCVILFCFILLACTAKS